jgi:hypothetical protein
MGHTTEIQVLYGKQIRYDEFDVKKVIKMLASRGELGDDKEDTASSRITLESEEYADALDLALTASAISDLLPNEYYFPFDLSVLIASYRNSSKFTGLVIRSVASDALVVGIELAGKKLYGYGAPNDLMCVTGSDKCRLSCTDEHVISRALAVLGVQSTVIERPNHMVLRIDGG